MYRKILEFSLNFLLGIFILFIVYSLNNKWNITIFYFLLVLIIIGFILVILRREKPRIDNIDSKTSVIQKTIVEELSLVFENTLANHNFKLYHREISPFQVDIRYKRVKDIIIFNFYYFPQDYPDWNADILISTRVLLRRSFISLLNLKNPSHKRMEKLSYSLINKKTNEIDKEQIINVVQNMKDDINKCAEEFLQGNYVNVKKEYSLNKKYYNKNYIHLFNHIRN